MTTTFNRRDLVRGMIGGAVAMALTPNVLAQIGPPPGVVRLMANENPYGPSPKALKEAATALHKGAYYPGGIRNDLLDVIAEKNGISRDNLYLSSGSNEGLQAAMVAYGKKGKVVLPGLTYSDHLGYSRRMGVELVRVPLKEDMSIDLDDTTGNRCNPPAPPGSCN